MTLRPAALNPIFAPVTRLKGVGEALTASITKLAPPPAGHAVPIIRDLAFHLPVGLIDRRRSYPLREAPDGVTATFVVTPVAHHAPPRSRFGGRKPYKVLCENDTGDVTLVFFHAREEYIHRVLPVGKPCVISGVVERFDYAVQMTHPDIIAPVHKLSEVQRVEPVYPLTAGLTNKRVTGLVNQALAAMPDLPEWAAAELPWQEALNQVHAPQEEADLLPSALARSRLAYDEALAHQLHLALLRQQAGEKAGRVVAPSQHLRQALRAALPFALTHGQEAVLSEVDADMQSGTRMARLVQGDVGSGKTLVALMAALSVVEAGAQAAVMVPTELIARQHARVMQEFCQTLDLRVCLLTGSLNAAARREVETAMRDGSAHIIIGTHALFQDSVAFHDLGLVVVDEQHRFGVAQRMALLRKVASGERPAHLLQMTATPIPRSLTMTLYGDMDHSVLREKPAGRQDITTRAIAASRFDPVAARLAEALKPRRKGLLGLPDD